MGNVNSDENSMINSKHLYNSNKDKQIQMKLEKPSPVKSDEDKNSRATYIRKLTQLDKTRKLQNSMQIIASEGVENFPFPNKSSSTKNITSMDEVSEINNKLYSLKGDIEYEKESKLESEDNQSCFPFRRIQSEIISAPAEVEKEFSCDSLRMSIGSKIQNSCEYVLDYVKSASDLRKSYIQKLIMKNVWTPDKKQKDHNTLIIFDWDDTLLPTSFLSPNGYFQENILLKSSEVEKIMKLEESVLGILEKAINKGDTYIITNAAPGWVEYSASRYYPKIVNLLKKIKILSARGQYEKVFPGDSRKWKIETFLEMQKLFDCKLITNLICIGDSIIEMEAAVILASKFSQAFIKTIKFRESPKPEELDKQLNLIKDQFNSIYSAVKNLTIKVERKSQK